MKLRKKPIKKPRKLTLKEKLEELWALGATTAVKTVRGRKAILYQFPSPAKVVIPKTHWMEGIEQIDPFPIDALFEIGFKRISIELHNGAYIIKGYHSHPLGHMGAFFMEESSTLKSEAVTALVKNLRDYKNLSHFKNYVTTNP